RRRQPTEPDPARRHRPADGSLPGADALHVARLPRGRRLRRSRLGPHRQSTRLVAVPAAQLRQPILWGALLLALAAPSVARADPPAPPPAVAPVAGPPAPGDDEGEPKLSLPTIADRDAWLRSGFRMGLALSYGELVGLGGAPSGRLLGFIVRLGIRLDRDWSLVTSLQYARASSRGARAARTSVRRGARWPARTPSRPRTRRCRPAAAWACRCSGAPSGPSC